eukprot:1184634-Prorocentrum_minimum.AAC.4
MSCWWSPHGRCRLERRAQAELVYTLSSSGSSQRGAGYGLHTYIYKQVLHFVVNQKRGVWGTLCIRTTEMSNSTP